MRKAARRVLMKLIVEQQTLKKSISVSAAQAAYRKRRG